ncbi:MAG: restriction endonuclease subunit S [Candidatus Hydrogenedentes bacterium]|nr:restriction endonuclease subunit S [Candidatus Hydrogenedentota bacterium]
MKQRNENRPRYKRTKVGWIPEEWDCIHLEDIAKVNPTFDKPIVHDCNVTFLAMADISEQGIVLARQERAYNSVSKGFTSFRDGDILIAKITPCFENGKGALLYDLVNGIGFGSTEFHVIRACKANRIFLYFWTQSRPFRARGGANMTGSAGQKRVPTDFIKKYMIPLPSLPEQERIAEVLSAWEKAIALTDRLIDAKQRLKKGLMQQLLTGRIRFLEFGKSEELRTKSEILKKGKLPQGWSVKYLGECFKERNETDSSLPLLSITGKRGVISRDDVDRKDTSNADKSKYKVIRIGDIGYNTMRMWQGVSAVSLLEGIVSPAYTICTPRKGHIANYYGNLFKYPPVVNLFHRYSQGLVNDTLNLKYHHFSQIKVVVPEETEQKQIAQVLFACDQEIQLLIRKRDVIKNQKKGLMQKLLTGEVRVSVSAMRSK